MEEKIVSIVSKPLRVRGSPTHIIEIVMRKKNQSNPAMVAKGLTGNPEFESRFGTRAITFVRLHLDVPCLKHFCLVDWVQLTS